MAIATRNPNDAGVSESRPLFPRQFAPAFVLVTGLFFLWGIPNNLNDVLIRQFMKSFEISRLQAGLVQSAFYAGYFTLSIPAAIIMQRRGYKAGLITGLLMYSCGTFLFLPAAHTRSYALFLLALFVIASGLAFLETGANPLIAQMGDQETAVRRLNFSQAFNPFGAIAGVLIGTIFIFSGVELNATDIARLKLGGTYTAYLEHETMRVIAPYIILGVVVLIWGLLILRTRFPSIESETFSSPVGLGNYKELFQYPHLLLAVLAQFCYVGAQVGTWSYFIQYIQDYVHLPEKTAGYLLTGTLVGFGVGRFSSSQLMKTIPANTLMGTFASMNVVLVAFAVIFPGWIGTIAIFMTSFFMSLMFPTIFALGIRGLGPHTKAASSLIVMAIIGGAVFTPLMGFVFQMTRSMALAMLVPLGCYLVVAFYALRGYELRSMAAQEM
jgi:FHS family L-fucose permease-like MFS transporter